MRVLLTLAYILLDAPDASAVCTTLSTDITHVTSLSYGELCGVGTITLRIDHPSRDTDLTDIVITEDLGASGLTYVPGTTTFSVRNGSAPAPFNPSISGSRLTWDLGSYVLLASGGGPSNAQYLEVTFEVQRLDEGFILADRTLSASLSYSTINEDNGFLPCSDTETSGPQVLPLHEPIPSFVKRGRNVDAAQSSGQYSSTVYGNTNDDVIWRVQVRNTGQAALQDLRIDDVMQPGNLVVNFACSSESAASAIAANNGAGPVAGCIPAGNTFTNFDVDNPFGNPSGDSPDLVDVAQGGSAYIYLVGKISNSCNANTVNTASDLQWGCEINAPAGGITATSTGTTPGSATATLSSRSVNSGNNLNVTTLITGVNTSQPVGSRGTVQITIRNTTGGTVKGIRLRDVLPPEYVVDPTFTPTVTMDPAYGTYPGMTDRIEWTNPAPGTFPLTTTNPALPLANTAPEFRLYSSTNHPVYGDQVDLLRHGDELVVTFRIVLVSPESFDRTANLDVRTESPGSDPPDTDPVHVTTLSNELYVDFEDFCAGPQQHPTYPIRTTHAAEPEDLDINIAGNELIFILTGDPAQRLPLTVNLTNNGGHDAANYFAYITFGATMNVVTVPGGCTPTSNPPLLDVWQDPAAIPPDAAVYLCTGSPVAPGQTVGFAFEVVKRTDPVSLAADDLTFRADVVGEVTLNSGAPLWFPAPANPRADGGSDRADNYSLDGIRARVIGFDLRKTQVGTCTENNPPPGSPDLLVQIGEECTYHIETGGWFGFQTPGFTYIAVQDIQVVDQMPDGQGYLRSTDPYATSTSAILGIGLHPPGLAPLMEVTGPDWVNWTFNQVIPAERITEKDHWFRVDIESRLLNDPLDVSALPNRQAALSTNILNSYFQAVFFNETTGLEEIYNLGPSTVGYPRESVRRIDLTVTEPHLTVVKEVCNETLYGPGPACSNFVPLASDGDAYSSYIYRLTVSNEASSGGVSRAPAYDVTVTDRLDGSDLAYVLPFGGDGLDNDGDGSSEPGDADGEGSLGDNLVKNGVPAEITFSHTHSAPLRRIDPGQSVRLHYRVDFDDDAAPLQTFTNTAEASYDSLAGESGSQSIPQRPGGDSGGARLYTSQAASASVRILPVETQPKRIARLSDTPLVSAPATQEVSIGEEIEYRLRTLLPVALLRDFVIRDELPPGLRCIEAPPVDLDASPYSAAGFDPGGTITPTCSGNLVEWDFGDQRLTSGTLGQRFEFDIGFIARLENTAATNDGDLVSNGDPATVARARYIDESGSPVVLNFGQVDVLVREPRVELTKSFAVAAADAGDHLTVTVTATNSGTANAYNLRILDDLTNRHLTYIQGSTSGADPPDAVDVATFDSNQPLFLWNSDRPLAPGDTFSFSFSVSVDPEVQPLEILDNTLQATWTSLPGQSTALNSTGLIGADGSDAGMRNGALPNAGHAVNDYETMADHQTVVPGVTLGKTDLAPAMVPAIGTHKPFRIEIRMPEGITGNLTVTDTLDAAGLSYVLANNDEFDITYSFEGIAAINGQPPSETAFHAFPADGTTGTALWNIGTVATQTEDDPARNAVDPVIRIEYRGRIHNDLATDGGDSMGNSATVTYPHGETGFPEVLTDGTAPVTVVEPLLTAAKTVSNVTPGKSPGDPASGGDLLEYVITLANTGTATAFDVTVVDTLSPGQVLFSGFTPTARIGGVSVAGFAATPSDAPAGPLVWGEGNGDGSLDLPAGQSLVLTYRVVVEEAVSLLTNTVYSAWTSLDGPSIYERTGSGCPDWTPPDDYCSGPATTSTATVDDTGFAKSVAEDSYDAPPLSTALDAVARVGDTVIYRLALELRGGLTREVLVEDVLPPGMAFVETVSINGDFTADYIPPASGTGSNFDYAPVTSADVPAAGETGAIRWNIGDVVNDPFGDPTTDILEILYRARILPDAGIPHTPSANLNNGASLSYLNAPPLSGGADISLLQPLIGQVTKIDRSGRPSGTTVDVAGDTMNFRLSACNASGQAPAYGVRVVDQLSSQLDEGSIAGPGNGPGRPDVTINALPALEGAANDYLYLPPAGRGGAMEFRLNTPVHPGQCVTIDYDIGFHTDFGPNQIWNNSATVEEYWSLPAQSGQVYGPVGPATFTMQNVANTEPPVKAVLSPLSGEATIGEEIVYRITVPGAAVNAAMYDVAITDILDGSLELVGVAEVSGNGLLLTDSSVPPGQVNLSIPRIPAGRQAVIEMRTRLRNLDSTNAGVTFSNTATYTFADTPGGAIRGGGSDTAAPVRIIEPSLAAAKTVTNVTHPGQPPRAGDILFYTLSFSAAGGAPGDDFAGAFDLRIEDSLSPGLAYHGPAAVSGAGNTIGDPVLTGDGTATGQSLVWSLEEGNADIDIPEGGVITVTYPVRVLDSVLANQTLTNAAVVRWTGLEGLQAHERNGTGTPPLNDYFTTPVATTLIVPDNNVISKVRISDTFGAADGNVRIGDIVEYEIRLGLQEGSHPDVVLTDTLPQGLLFAGIASVNGDGSSPYGATAPFLHPDLSGAGLSVTGDPSAGPTVLTWNLGDIVNGADGDGTNDAFVIVYRARVLNEVLPQQDAIPLLNTARLDYGTATGPAPTKAASETVTIIQPNLTVSKTAVAAGGDAILSADEIVTYTVEITNSGTAPAYDAVLEDILPVGLREGGLAMVEMGLVSGPALPILLPAYDPATGTAVWNLDTGGAGQIAIPPGDTLRLVYQARADASIGAGLTLTNQARVTVYFSFDDEAVPVLGGVSGTREVYGPSNTATTTFITEMPGALSKANPAVSAVAVGEPFTYRITVPAVPLETALHDVRILDDLSLSVAELRLLEVVKVSGSMPWTPVNTGTSTDIVLEDTAGGIDIPAGEQAVIDITVVLEDTPTNVSGLQFANTASYTFNRIGNDSTSQASGGPDTTGSLTIAGPDALILQKTGPATLQAGVPATFTLDLHNPATGPAWTPTVTDRLPHSSQGGMCSGEPVLVEARIFQADGVTPVSSLLLPGTDFTTSFAGAPECQWSITLLPPAGAVGPDQRLILRYEVELDPGTANGIDLTNVAGVTRWTSADPSAGGTPRVYVRDLTDGTPGIADHEDAHSITAQTPVLVFRKTVENLTTGQNPGKDARPGDTLRYTLQVTNTGPVGLPSFSIVDELDQLNATSVFAPGSLNLLSVPPGSDTSGTSSTGGARGTGLVSVGNLILGAQGEGNETVTVVFEATLVPVITSGTVVLNQAGIVSANPRPLLSDDPDVNGQDDPGIPGDEDPTATLIASAPRLEIRKISTVLSGDPAVLMAGETLRYILTVRNTGNEDAVNVSLRDYIPLNTTYLPDSTTLNGMAVPDPSPGISALQTGMPVNAPADPRSGFLPADVPQAAANLATVTFEVVVDPGVMDGLVIENQGFAAYDGAGSGVRPEEPSDDPSTPALLDPTRDVVGNLPLLAARKTVEILEDFGSVGIVDPGDVLRYTITLTNYGAIPATGVTLTDAVPVHTTYIADSLRLNGAPAGSDGGVSPLIGGLAVQSSDGPGSGILSAGGSAVITFEVRVDPGTVPGTLISNQGSVASTELPPMPTDADGLPSNGHQPTIVVVGDVQLLSVSKEVLVVGGGTAQAGGELEYVIRVGNVGSVPATGVVISDDLAPPLGDLVTYVPGSGTLNGAVNGVGTSGFLLSADYGSVYGDLPPGGQAVLRFRVRIAPSQAVGATITNTGTVRWNDPARTLSASVSLDVGGTPGSAILNGSVWHDGNLDGLDDGTERRLEGWSVDLYRNGQRVAGALTDGRGVYRLGGLLPNEGTSEPYEIRFRAPGAGPNTASLGHARSVFINGPQRISGISVASGANLQGLDLPITPNGTVYNSVQRTAVAGARVALLNAGSGVALPSGCFDDPGQQNQLTPLDGYYKFDLNFSDPSCPVGSAYLLEITPPAGGYLPEPSQIIPPASSSGTAPFDVAGSLGSAGDALPATTETLEVTDSASVPPPSVTPRSEGTTYHLLLLLGNGLVPGHSQVFNNHIPIDPELAGAVAIAKTSPMINVSKGQLVPYTITVKNVYGVPLYDLGIVDRFPPGFKYVKGSGRLDGNPGEPHVEGRELVWDIPELQFNDQHAIQLLLVVGAGVSEGDYVNRAQVIHPASGRFASGEATATVRVVPDPTFDCTDVIGKVFDDRNLDGVQDKGEEGLAGVRVVTARGLIATTDEHGRFHITCAVEPDQDRGSNFILKLDDRTLPTGYRLTTENPRVQRATRGKMMKFNFGATIHRVVGLDIADGVFEADSTDMRPQWKPKVSRLLEELRKSPSILRLSYLGDVEGEGLVSRRLEALKELVGREWSRAGGGYRLAIETEVFWRRGAPP